MSDIPLLVADAVGLGSLFGPPQWGIFAQGGTPILVVDSVASVEYARDYHVSDFPQEQGAFASYNKVQVPFQAKVSFLIGPSRTDFLNAVEAAVASLDFVSVVTPEISYPNANLTHYSYRREVRSGVTLIRVDVWCEEIRIIPGTITTTTAASGNTTAASGVNATASAETTAGISAGATQSTNAAIPTQSGQVQPSSGQGGGTPTGTFLEIVEPPLNPPT